MPVGASVWLPALIAGGSQIAGSAMNSKAQGKAADAQAAAIEKGIALQDKMYEQDRSDFAPYRQLGAGAVGNLQYLSGITPPPMGPDLGQAAGQALSTPLTQGPQAPKAPVWNAPTQIQNTADKINAKAPGTVVKVSRNGQTRVIPPTLLPKAIQDGWAQLQ